MTTGTDAANTVAIYNKGREIGKQQGTEWERAAVVAFLRKRTHLGALAELIGSGVHLLGEKEQNAWAAERKLSLTGPLWPMKGK